MYKGPVDRRGEESISFVKLFSGKRISWRIESDRATVLTTSRVRTSTTARGGDQFDEI
jgi:hypothetical protein